MQVDKQEADTKALEIDAGVYAGDTDALVQQHIRILENRLDKALIKYNEAQSIKRTYEQIVRRLREERITFDNQVRKRILPLELLSDMSGLKY